MTVGVFLCIRGARHCSGSPLLKRNLTSDDRTPFTEECPLAVTWMCYRGNCYCRLYQNTNMRFKFENLQSMSEGFTEESQATKSGYNNLWNTTLMTLLNKLYRLRNFPTWGCGRTSAFKRAPHIWSPTIPWLRAWPNLSQGMTGRSLAL